MRTNQIGMKTVQSCVLLLPDFLGLAGAQENEFGREGVLSSITLQKAVHPTPPRPSNSHTARSQA
jgi:hypothetical protein